MIDTAGADALRESHPEAIAAGTYIMDVLGRPVAELPVGQISLILDEIRPTPAGTAGGMAVDLARLGARVVAVGAIGNDLAGDGSRPAWHVPGANSTFEIEDVDWGAVDRAAAVHLGGLTALPAIDGEPAGRLLARARAHGALTTADFLGVRGQDVPSVLAPVLPHVDIFMPNEGEALTVARDPDCVTERTLPAHDVPVVDTTGCGDAFCAGVIVAWLAGWSIDHAAELGCATGALNLRGLGSDVGARDVDEALAFMRDAPLRIGPSVSGDPSLGRLRQLSEAG